MTDKELQTLAYALAREDAKARLNTQGVKPSQVTVKALNHVTFQLYQQQKALYLRMAKKALKRAERKGKR